jgi:2-oxoisovalerate dehydrogenase E1 component
MLDRAKIVDENFTKFIREKRFPIARTITKPHEIGLYKEIFLQLFESQLLSRHLDLIARWLKEKNLGFYTIGSSGHEGNAAIAKVFRHTDMAFLHYRSGAFMIQRARHLPNLDPVYDHLLSLMASSEDPIASGRHKVFGSVPLFVPPQTSTIASHLPKAVGAAVSITRARELSLKSRLPYDSVILCSFGDASLNHSTAQGALNAAQWIAHQQYPLPLVFICEDNGIGISVPTPAKWIDETLASRPAIHYLQADGLNLVDVYRAAEEAQRIARYKKQPVFLHLKTVRLLGHAGSDIESQYLSQQIIEETEFNDPLLHSAQIILDNHYLSSDEIISLYEDARLEVKKKMEKAIKRPRLKNAKEVMNSLVPSKTKIALPSIPTKASREKIFGTQFQQLKIKRNLSQMINLALTDLLLQYPNILLYGEDVAKKGGVYRVTAGLMEKFGQRRVFDSLLDEQTILGHAIGFAHNGFLPIPEIQFLAYLHNAEDQLRGEASTLSFFSSGQYTNPMVIRIAGLAYQKGFGGHFHNDNSLAVLRDIPGIIIACPSNGLDAVKMLRECVRLAYQEKRIVIFIEPIALYMTKDLYEEGDAHWLSAYPEPKEKIAFNEIGVYGKGKDLVIITYGNGYYLSRQAEKELKEKYQIKIKIIDLRWLSPLPEKEILKEIKNYQQILIVDECRKTGSLSEALVTLLVENINPLPNIKRITGEDSFIPLGEAWKYVLPSKEDIVKAVRKMVVDKRH